MQSRQELITRASEDAAFRAQLLSDPRGTLEREFATSLPADLEVTVLEETPRHANLVLPGQQLDLSADDLARLSAGAGSWGLEAMTVFQTTGSYG